MAEMEKHAHLGMTVLPHHPIPHTFPGVLVAALLTQGSGESVTGVQGVD